MWDMCRSQTRTLNPNLLDLPKRTDVPGIMKMKHGLAYSREPVGQFTSKAGYVYIVNLMSGGCSFCVSLLRLGQVWNDYTSRFWR